VRNTRFTSVEAVGEKVTDDHAFVPVVKVANGQVGNETVALRKIDNKWFVVMRDNPNSGRNCDGLARRSEQ
jgi:hypothetical protein